jgi:hypothetical protein
MQLIREPPSFISSFALKYHGKKNLLNLFKNPSSANLQLSNNLQEKTVHDTIY